MIANANKQFDRLLDTEEFISDPEIWNEDIARAIARNDGLPGLTRDHWIIIHALLVLVLLTPLDISLYWLLLPAAFMLATFVTAVEFARHISNVHLSEFTDTLHIYWCSCKTPVTDSRVANMRKPIKEVNNHGYTDIVTTYTGHPVRRAQLGCHNATTA